MFRRKKQEEAPANLGPKITLPVDSPLAECPREAAAKLSEEELAHYHTALTHFLDEKLVLPTSENDESAKQPLDVYEKAWLTEDCFLRYLRACSWNTDEAIKRIERSVVWRREFGIAKGVLGEDKITPESLSDENETGKQLLFGFDNESRPCLYLRNGRENSKSSFRQIQFLMLMLELTIDYMPPGQDKIALCVDFKSVPEICKESTTPSVSVGKQVLHILQYHYPERLGRALFINIPWLAWAFLKICYPFVDPYTKKKCAFDEPFGNYIPSKQLPAEYGGDVNFVYSHDQYWPELIRLAKAKKSKYMENFERLGSKIGLKEYDLRS